MRILREFRLLKNLPDFKAGTIFKQINDSIKSKYRAEVLDSNILHSREYGHTFIEDNKEWFEEIIKKFKVGDWIYSLEEIHPYREVGDVFQILECSFDSFYYIDDTCSSDPSSFRLATDDEITEHLKEKAKEKGFKTGTIYKGFSFKDSITKVGNFDKLQYYHEKCDEYLTDGYGGSIWQNGKWAEIIVELISKPLFKVNDYVKCVKGDISKITYGAGWKEGLVFKITSIRENLGFNEDRSERYYCYFGGYNTHEVYSPHVVKATQEEIDNLNPDIKTITVTKAGLKKAVFGTFTTDELVDTIWNNLKEK